MEKIKSYLKELVIVTVGVLIALLISNFNENSQARKYHKASVETVKNEIISNYSSLESTIENQEALLDTITKYTDAPLGVTELFLKADGLQIATLKNSGLEFYSKNKINSIDPDILTYLINMNNLSKFVNTKVEKMMSYVYQNPFVTSVESKKVLAFYLHDILESETQLLYLYDSFKKEYVDSSDQVIDE